MIWAWLCCDLDAYDWPTVCVGGVYTSFLAAWGSQESSKASWSAASFVNTDIFLNELTDSPQPQVTFCNHLQVSALQAVTTHCFLRLGSKGFLVVSDK